MRRDRSVMVDIESKSLRPGCFILSIGAVSFLDDGFIKDWEKAEAQTFYGQVPWDDVQQSHDRDIDPGTLKWWAESGQAQARSSFDFPHPDHKCVDIIELLSNFNTFLSNDLSSGGRLICQHTHFDVAAIGDACDYYGVVKAWNYRQPFDLPTFIESCYDAGIGRLQVERDGVAHHALDDAIHQARRYQKFRHELWKIRHKGAQTDLFGRAT